MLSKYTYLRILQLNISFCSSIIMKYNYIYYKSTSDFPVWRFNALFRRCSVVAVVQDSFTGIVFGGSTQAACNARQRGQWFELPLLRGKDPVLVRACHYKEIPEPSNLQSFSSPQAKTKTNQTKKNGDRGIKQPLIYMKIWDALPSSPPHLVNHTCGRHGYWLYKCGSLLTRQGLWRPSTLL